MKIKFKKFEKSKSVPKDIPKSHYDDTSGPCVLDIVPCLEPFGTFGTSVVNILGVGDELRRRGRNIGGRHFKWRTG